MALTDSSGAVVAEYEYDVYGEVTSQTGTADTEFDFAGEQTDGSTGLQYLRARYMDPTKGRFISRDPLAGMPAWVDQPYSYVDASPVTLIDPYGLWGMPSWDDVKDVGSAIGEGAKDVGGGFHSGAEWLIEDYHWADAAGIAGGFMFDAGLATGNPWLIGGGLVLVGIGTLGAAADGAACRSGSTASCVAFGSGVLSTVLFPFAVPPFPKSAYTSGFAVALDLVGSAVGPVSDYLTEGESPNGHLIHESGK